MDTRAAVVNHKAMTTRTVHSLNFIYCGVYPKVILLVFIVTTDHMFSRMAAILIPDMHSASIFCVSLLIFWFYLSIIY